MRGEVGGWIGGWAGGWVSGGATVGVLKWVGTVLRSDRTLTYMHTHIHGAPVEATSVHSQEELPSHRACMLHIFSHYNDSCSVDPCDTRALCPLSHRRPLAMNNPHTNPLLGVELFQAIDDT